MCDDLRHPATRRALRRGFSAVRTLQRMRGVPVRLPLHVLGILGQAFLLSVIGGLGPASSAGLLALAASLALVLAAAWRVLPPAADMPLAMLTLGGLGMTLGWRADLYASGSWCASGTPALMSWMNAGMLALGVPAMRWLGRDPSRCSTLACLVAAPWMVLGMRLGARLANLLTPWLEADQLLLTDYALMTLGMLLGMVVAALPARAGAAAPVARPRVVRHRLPVASLPSPN
jgi:hypothetical protein